MNVLLKNFLEENWSAFIFRAEECGYTEEDCEKFLEKLMNNPGLN